MRLSVRGVSKRRKAKANKYIPIDGATGENLKGVWMADTREGIYGRYVRDGNGKIQLNMEMTAVLTEICRGKVRFRKVAA
jgi:hypothetical protein